ncbi:hypothetical protein JCM6882_001459 [Rhodosporidiobolus microsporus]
MFTSYGFSIHLALGNQPLLPLSSRELDAAPIKVNYTCPASSLIAGTPWLLQWRDDRLVSSSDAPPTTTGTVFMQLDDGGRQAMLGSVKSRAGEGGVATLHGKLETTCSGFTLSLVLDEVSTNALKSSPLAVFSLVITALPDPALDSISPRQLEEEVPSPHSSPGFPRPPMVEISASEYLNLQQEARTAQRAAQNAHAAFHSLLPAVPLPARIAALDASLRAGHTLDPPMAPERRFKLGIEKHELLCELQGRADEKVRGEMVRIVEAALRGAQGSSSG